VLVSRKVPARSRAWLLDTKVERTCFQVEYRPWVIAWQERSSRRSADSIRKGAADKHICCGDRLVVLTNERAYTGQAAIWKAQFCGPFC
jgi:hypothetical protein